jgi:hypothetical protein
MTAMTIPGIGTDAFRGTWSPLGGSGQAHHRCWRWCDVAPPP